ncbi:MAG: sulfurtransferase TusA family protein [Lachnospiraceae bacterium]
MVRKAVAAEKPAELEVLVDNQCSVENVTRYGQSQGYKVETAPEGADFRLKLKK